MTKDGSLWLRKTARPARDGRRSLVCYSSLSWPWPWQIAASRWRGQQFRHGSIEIIQSPSSQKCRTIYAQRVLERSICQACSLKQNRGVRQHQQPRSDLKTMTGPAALVRPVSSPCRCVDNRARHGTVRARPARTILRHAAARGGSARCWMWIRYSKSRTMTPAKADGRLPTEHSRSRDIETRAPIGTPGCGRR